MELLNRFPKGFFRIPSEISKSSNNPDDKIIPIKWKKEKNKDKIIVNSVKKNKINMCKIGDIIVVKKNIGDDGTIVNRQHSFVVIDNNQDEVEGIAYDLVANVMSSFKNEEHRKKKIKHKENLEIISDNIISNTKNSRNGFIKADQLFYFDKSKLDYYIFASISPELLDELIRLIIELRLEGKLKMNIKNIESNIN